MMTLLAIVPASVARAFSLDTYASESALSQGRWVKVSVPQSGLYLISNDDLRRMGYTDASRVRVHGYGAQPIPDLLVAENYIDDLPLTQSMVTPAGIVFYAQGPETVTAMGDRKRVTPNQYSTLAYYFVTETDSAASAIPVQEERRGMQTPATTFTDYAHHEQDLVSPGESGWVLVGEDFKYTPARTIKMALPGRVEGTPATIECSFVANTPTTGSTLQLAIPGVDASELKTIAVSRCANDHYVHGSETLAQRAIGTLKGQQADVTLTFRQSGSIQGAWLNYLTISYERAISLAQGSLCFDTDAPSVALADAPASTVVWDVTAPRAMRQMALTADGSAQTWTNAYSGTRRYAAFDPAKASTLPRVTIAGTVSPQNLHAMATPDMVIVTPREWYDQAQRVAAMHSNDQADPLDVSVVVDTDVYNEFGSGAADVGALRRFFKMLYDRGLQGQGRPLRYALLMARSTVDNRHATAAFRGTCGFPTIPQWMGGTVSASLDDNSGYGSDDHMAILQDGTGARFDAELLDIAIGRMPVRSVAEARSAVDKLVRYVEKAKSSDWRGRITLLCDDGNQAAHMQQGDAFATEAVKPSTSPYVVEKVYIDAYERVGDTYPEAREKMYRLLDQGSAWWGFIGHANNHSWTADGMLTYTDINNLYLKHQPMLLATTCDFMRWDSNTESGAEIMWHNPTGGIIGAISATRPVYISSNGYMSQKMGKNMALRDADGHLYSVGEIYRRAKNDILLDYKKGYGQGLSSNSNARRYVLMADPALQIATPHQQVVLDSIDGRPFDPSNPPTLAALQHARLCGRVTSPLGQDVTDFEGHVTLTLYDAETSTVSNGAEDGGGEGVQYAFDEMGSLLLSVSAPVSGGRFDCRVSLPQEVADNWRPATLSMYAVDTRGKEASLASQAIGVTRDLYVYGRDNGAATDTVPPVIDRLRLNTDDFASGDIVNASPMLMADLSDDMGINLSSAGIGHAMNVLIDGRTTLSDVSLYYTPSPMSEQPGGTVAYPLSGLQQGPHTLTFKVWDTSGNLTTASIDFNVDLSARPSIIDVYTDANPAHTEANFYIRHDRPDAMTGVTVEVFDLLGRPLWQHTETGRSDMHMTAPLKWDLTDSAGRRVPRGIYLYRATVTEEGGQRATSESRKIAVAAY